MVQGVMRRELQVTDIEEITAILDKAKIVHLGLSDDNEPYVVPMNYGYTLENGKLTLFIHGATEGKKLDIMRKNPKISFSIETDVEPFTGRVACQYGMTYSSVFGKGTAEILEDPAEKIAGLSQFMKSQTGMDFEFNERMVSAVSVIKLNISEYTAKRRPLPVAMTK